MPTIQKVIWDVSFALNKGEAEIKRTATELNRLDNILKTTKKDSLEYVKAERQMIQLSKQMSKEFNTLAGSTDRFGSSIKKGVAQLRNLAAIGSTALIIRNATNEIIGFEKAISGLSAITGAVGGDLEFLEDQAREFGRTTTISAQESIEAFKKVGSARPALLANKEALAAVTNEAIILAEASGLALPAAADALTTVMNQFNLEADQSREIIDALAAGSLKGAADIPTLTQTIERAGTVLAQNNVTFQESIALTETLADKQLTGAEAGTALRGVILKLTKTGKGFVDGQFDITAALEQVKQELDNIADPAERANEAIKLFGEEGITAGNILLNNIDRFTELTSAVGEGGTALEQAEVQTANLAGELDRLRNKWTDIILDFKGGSGLASQALRFLGENLRTILKVLGLIIAAWVSYKAAILVARNVSALYRASVIALRIAKIALTQGIGNATKAMKAFNVSVRANPIGLLVGAITTAVSAFVLFKDNADEASEAQERFNAAAEEGRAIQAGFTGLEKQIQVLDKLNQSQAEDLLSNIQNAQATNQSKLAEVIATERSITGKTIGELQAQIDTLRKVNFDNITDGPFPVDVEAAKQANQNFIEQLERSKRKLLDAAEVEEGITSIELTEQLKRLEQYRKDVQERIAILKKGEKDQGDVIKKGTIAVLQDEVSALLKRITTDLTIGSGEFNEAVDKYIVKAKELKAARDLLAEDAPGPTEGSIDFLQDQVNSLRKLLNAVNLETSDFEDLLARLNAAEADLAEARKRIQGEKKDGGKGDVFTAEQKETQRHALAVLGITNAGEERILQAKIRFAKARLRLVKETFGLESIEYKKQVNVLKELEAQMAAISINTMNQIRDEILQGSIEVFFAGSQAAISSAQVQIEQLDRVIEAQRTKVDDALQLAEDGNTKLLELEQQRLDKLIEAREEHVQRQQNLALIETGANAVIAISKAAAEGGAAAAFTITATLIALAAGFAQARALASSSASFFVGGPADWSDMGGYTGDGNPHSLASGVGRKPYSYHKQEFVMNHETTGTGNNRKWFDWIHTNRVDLDRYFGGQMSGQSGGMSEAKANEIIEAIQEIPGTTFRISKDGIFTMVQKKSNMRSRIKTKT